MHPDWVLGYADEVWWSRLAQPQLHTWTAEQPLRLEAKTATKHDPEPKALACYGLLRADTQQLWLRFVAGRPLSALTTQFLHWSGQQLQRQGKRALLVVWDNASWHISREVRQWVRAHNTAAKRTGGVRLVLCQLPAKSPWLNRIEPHWVHGKKAIVEPQRKLTAAEVMARVHTYYGCKQWPLLSQ
jgi:DDE superfamily endonuclease